MDRLPWSRFHWRVIVGLGTVWILDGLEVTIIGGISGRIGEKGAGVGITTAQVSGLGASLYIAGACLGPLVFGQLTDRFGRKKLFMITLGVYLLGTVLTAFSFSPLWFYVCRVITGFGIGGEYSAINSAIDELIPAAHRGRVNNSINGSYWAGAAGGALLAVLALNKGIFAVNIGWRLCFGLGAALGLGVLLLRRSVPESPRWLFIHGREQEAEEIVADIERQVRESTGTELPEPAGEMTVRQRRVIPLSLTLRSVFTLYPKRTVLGLALFVGQAFLYNSILFSLGDLLGTYFKVASGDVPYYLVVFAVGNLFGPLVLGRLFDTVGRKPMIAGTYILSGILLIITAVLFNAHQLTASSLTVALTILFFFASAGCERGVFDCLRDLPDGDQSPVSTLQRGSGSPASRIRDKKAFSNSDCVHWGEPRSSSIAVRSAPMPRRPLLRSSVACSAHQSRRSVRSAFSSASRSRWARPRRRRSQIPEGRRGAVAEDSVGPAGEHRRHRAVSRR